MRKQGLFFQETDKSPTVEKLAARSEIETAYQWRLEDIYESDEAWEEGFRQVEGDIPAIETFHGRLAESAETLLKCLQLQDQIEENLYRLYLYAGLKNDQDTQIARYQSYRDRITSLMVKVNQAMSFIDPEILAIPEDRLHTFMEEKSGLNIYRHALHDLLRSREHVLPPDQERLLAMAGEISQAPYQIFSMFNNADIKFPSILDEHNVEVEVTKGRYSRFMESRDQRVRQDAFFAMYDTYGQWTHTLAATLSAAIKRNLFHARARKYRSPLEAALDSDNIPLAVYDNVINTINARLSPLHRYMKLRKRMLKLPELHPWDLSVPLVSEIDDKISYQEAQEMIIDALHPLGDEYQAMIEKSFTAGWIDVYENRGKRSGAYSWSTYGIHPYILLNYQDTVNDMLTLAHELGHALHSHYTQQAQPYRYSHYTIFVAEVASTVNEALLMDFLLKHTDERQKKLNLLNKYVDQIRGTVYIQSLFAEYEKKIHEKLESGESLTAETLNQLTRKLYLRYLGADFKMDEAYDINWCRIPHFYYNFYVYQYVTGFSAATALSQKILAGDSETRDAYLRFLSRGNSDYSIDLLQEAGVDMTSPEPITATTLLMNRLLDEMEVLADQGA